MTGTGDRVVQSGESDLITFEYENKPDPDVVFEKVGSDPDIRYLVDWDKRQSPSPEQFERLGHLEVKLVVMNTDLPDELQEKADAAHEAIVELKDAMMEHRGLDENQKQDLAMGNLDALPEVEQR